MMHDEVPHLRPVISWTVAICVAVAIAPWLSGGQEPVARVLSAGAVLLGSLLVWRQPQVRQLRRGPLVWAYVGLVGWAALSLLWTANRYSTLLWLMGLILAGLVFRLAYVVAGEAAGRRRLIQLYLVSAGLVVVYGGWLYLTDAYDRFTSSFYWANPAAAYLIPALFISWQAAQQAKGKRRWVWLGVVGYGAAFVLADSRAAAAVLVVLAGVYLLAQRQSRRYWIQLLFTIITVVILSQASIQIRHWLRPDVVVTTPGSRFMEATLGESQSGSDRVQYLVSAGEMWWSRPVTGIGAGAYGDVHPAYQDRVVSAATSAHNFYVQVLAELGLVGGLLLAWLLVALMVGLGRGLWQRGVMAVPLVLGLGAILLHSGLDIDARYPAILGLAGVLAGVVYGQGRPMRERMSWRVPALAVGLLVLATGFHQSSTWAQRGAIAQAEHDYGQAAEQFDRAGAGWVVNPDWINAAGINWYTQAVGAEGARRQEVLARALDRAQMAQRRDGADGQHYQLEGRVRRLAGDTAGAERAYRTALRLDPHNHPEYALDLAQLQLQLRRTDEAVATARGMLDQYPDEVIANRSNDRTVRPNVANLWALVGNVALQQGDMVTARRAVGRALTIDGQNLRGRALKHQVDQR